MQLFTSALAGNYMFKVNNRNTRTLELKHWNCSIVSIVNFEQVNAGWGMRF